MNKQPKIKYTAMCIYIDEHVYESDHDAELIFNYLQQLFYILAVKRKYFNKFSDYQDYSLYAATQTYMRLVNKRQFLPESDPKHLRRIKSILNFIKKVMYPLKVNFQDKFFNCVVHDTEENPELCEGIKKEIESNIVNNNTNDLMRADIQIYLNQIPKTIKNFIKQSIVIKNEKEESELYISCLITFLKSITLSNDNKKKLFNSNNILRKNADDILCKLLEEERIGADTVFHLDKNLLNYVHVITNEIKKLLSKDISELTNEYIISDDMMQDLLMYPISHKEN